MTWLSPHRDSPAPAPFEFLIGSARMDLLVLHCPACGEQRDLEGDAQPFGIIRALIDDHVRTHAANPWR